MPYQQFIKSLENGSLRSAYKQNDTWVVNFEVKEKILEVLRNSPTVAVNGFCDKKDLLSRRFTLDDNIRMLVGGSSVRAGAYVGKKVIIAPPAYINVGAYVDDETMVDSHALVGSCAQIGKRVHLSAAVQIGGVLEPIGSRPVIVEDDCFIGAGCSILEGVLVRKKAVLAPGVILSASVPIYDLVNKTILKNEIPENAVVISGSRAVKDSEWAKVEGLQMSCALIVKYRDEKTNSALQLEEAMR